MVAMVIPVEPLELVEHRTVFLDLLEIHFHEFSNLVFMTPIVLITSLHEVT